MNDIENMLIENDCDAETIATIVNDIKKLADEHSILQDSIAMAILLKVFAGIGTDDRDEQLKMIFDIADCYDINLH
nr:MAG TPA: SRP54-type protein, helical bundle domain [Caudoviricetes sp.]